MKFVNYTEDQSNCEKLDLLFQVDSKKVRFTHLITEILEISDGYNPYQSSLILENQYRKKIEHCYNQLLKIGENKND